MNLKQACKKASEQLNLNVDYDTAMTDTLGGYHADPREQKWDIGSIWGVEGQFIYAILRAQQPKLVVQLGTLSGCSAAHIAQALHDNEGGELITVDRNGFDVKTLPKHLRKYVTFVQGDALDYVQNDMPARRVDVVFEDLWHDADEITALWLAAQDKIKKGALLINHDADHYVVGDAVRRGIAGAGMDVTVYRIEPADCGLAVWQNA